MNETWTSNMPEKDENLKKKSSLSEFSSEENQNSRGDSKMQQLFW